MLTGHLDHLGILPGKNGDTIANGAMDNAAGIATMLEAARAFVESGVRPMRSILFVALTGEEKGLQGSAYLARHPLPTGHRTVANVNLDMPILTYDFADVIAFGAEHSTMGPIVARALAQDGLTLSPDPTPDEGLFTRSDHYSFVKQGVPAVFLKTGFGGSGKAASDKFRAAHYHQVSDEVEQPFDWRAGARFARINYLIARELANAPEAPKWYNGSYFGELFASEQPKAPRAQ
jgi:Zn-dependent M28 family amino/carboxypeptidase